MKVLLVDKLAPHLAATLRAAAFDVEEAPATSGEALVARLSAFDPHVLVVRSTEVRAEHVAAAPGLGLVVRAGAGVNTIDVAACSARAVYVANTPGKNAIAVAELVMGLLVAADRRIPDAAMDVRGGSWRKGHWAKGADGLAGRTLAILGLGRIGAAVATRAQAFGMKVRAWSRSLDEAAADALRVNRCATPLDAARDADALTVHTALAPATRGLVGADVLDALADRAIVVNAARAEVMDEAALLDAIRRKGLRVALDVLSTEPTSGDRVAHALIDEPGVLVTPHLGASTRQAEEAVADEVIRIVKGYRDRGEVEHGVNRAPTGADATLVVRHLDRVGVLAAVLDRLRRANLNVAEMSNAILSGGQAAVARIQVQGHVDDDVIAQIATAEHVLAVHRT